MYDLMECVDRQKSEVAARYGQKITTMLATHRVPRGVTVVANARPTQIVVNRTDLLELPNRTDLFARSQSKDRVDTFMGLPIIWDNSP